MLSLLIVNSAPPCHRPPGRQTERGEAHRTSPSASAHLPLRSSSSSLTAPSKPDYRPASTHPSSWNQLLRERIIHCGLFQTPDIYFRPQMNSASEWNLKHLCFRGWGSITASDSWKRTSPPHKAPPLPSGLLERSAGLADAQPDDGGWRQRREQLRVGGWVRDKE